MEVELETGRVTLEEHVAKLVAELDERDVDTRIAASEALGEALRENRTLQRLTLTCNRIGDLGRRVLRECLEGRAVELAR